MRLSGGQMASVRIALPAVPEGPGKGGLHYQLPTALMLVLAAHLAGNRKLTDTSEFGGALSQDTLRRVGTLTPADSALPSARQQHPPLRAQGA